ncbi:MAG: hypothetical protein JWQ21_2085 [Herminiimonas sp.]|nr:hypothetical protein [Herminiimonas sp.]
MQFVDYRQSEATGRRFGFVREIFFTKVIDIDKEESKLFSSLPTSTRRKIKRAYSERISFEEVGDMAAFANFFNAFSRQKNLAFRLTPDFLEKFGKSLLITAAAKDREVLVMHANLRHPDTGRARLLYSASVLRAADKTVSKSVIGFANRALHFHDMCILGRQGFRLYDMGGYAVGTNNPELQGVNRFKDQFGGTLIREGNYRSIPLHVASTLYNAVTAPLEDMALVRIFRPRSRLAVAPENEAPPRRTPTS